MKAEPLFHEKRLLLNRETGDVAVAELKVWRVPKSSHYPDGTKYSLYLVVGGEVLVGIDNHKPKGPHLHLGDREVPYAYRGVDMLLSNFWDLARKAGYQP